MIYLRRTDEHGRVLVLKRRFEGDPHWPHRLVRIEGDLDKDTIHVFRLRKKDPNDQPLHRSIPYRFPRTRFCD